ncbi:hypothetical protein C4K04_2750 [Pseudomonas chlororaphis]|uniref:Uncharacterized protein n=1 Tax=Pseudomonas chlororaphis TaxID=587753 RepID=A0A3G7TPU5_9PSED|nr:hypothetical protein [Pseudomonas chlororaphis]AZE48422.1 hypothetical protein C4K04_2750 [Pseudomonas chlororaphis]
MNRGSVGGASFMAGCEVDGGSREMPLKATNGHCCGPIDGRQTAVVEIILVTGKRV